MTGHLDNAANVNLLAELRKVLGPSGVLDDAAARTVYARDASHLALGQPLAVALPRTDREAAAAVAACTRAGVPVVCRGAGTGLSGGAVPPEGAVVLSLARLSDLGPVDAAANRVRVGAGVLNEQVSRHARAHGLHFAPDPSSQAAATIGGNIAENAGGPHCLRHGVTLQHLRRLEWCDAAGRAWTTGRGGPAVRGFDLVSLLCGSEGTLAVVTAAELGLTPDPAATATLMVVFDALDDATGAVVRLLGAGLLPVAVELVDRPMLVAVEEAFGFGFPTDCDAVMIAEFAGAAAEVTEDAAAARTLLLEAGARQADLAADASARDRLWMARKKAFGAVGRLAPAYVSMDVVVPLGRLAPLVHDIQAIKAEHGVEIGTVFHAGDGNLHPGIHFDDRDPEAREKAYAAADAIIRRALDHGGSVTGEHGVGMEKLHVLPWQVDREAARLMHGIKELFDPEGILNPGKALPGMESAWSDLPPVPGEVRFAWDDLTVTVPARTSLAAVQEAALARGLWIPVGGWRTGDLPGLGTLPDAGTAVDQLVPGPGLVGGSTLRDVLLEVWAEDGEGRPFHAGAPVLKNVAGYDLVHLLAGAGGCLAGLQAATFKLSPAPPVLAVNVARGQVAEAWPALAGLLTDCGGPGAPTVIMDETAGGLWLVLAGRDRAWDLEGFLHRWQETARTGGLEPAGTERGSLAAAPALLAAAGVPEWALGSADWTMLTSADGGPCPRPPQGGRWIRTAAPRLDWVPARVSAPDASWAADTVWAEGEPAPLPRPAPGVPRELLAGWKRLFDPTNTLPTPNWLQGRGGQDDGDA